MTEPGPRGTPAGAPATAADGHGGRIVVDGRPVSFEPGDSVAIAIVRAGEAPARGGTLCLAGDCGNCLGVVDGIAYVRTCQVPARPGTRVERHPADENPPLPVVDVANPVAVPPVAEVTVRRVQAEVVIVGGGDSGRRAAADHPGALVLDAGEGNEVVAVYPGPTVVARTPDGMLHVETERIVVATGAAEIQPVCPGNDLDGLLTPRAAERLRAAGVTLPEPVVTVGPELVRLRRRCGRPRPGGRDARRTDRRRDAPPGPHRDRGPGPRATRPAGSHGRPRDERRGGRRRRRGRIRSRRRPPTRPRSSAAA